MQKIKIFIGMQDDVGSLETQINDWISQNGVEIIRMNSNIAPQTPKPDVKTTPIAGAGATLTASPASDVMVTILYESRD